MRTALAILLVVHGAIHLLGFVKAFGFAALPQLHQAVSRPMGVVWLVAGLLFVAAAFTPLRWHWWWAVAAAIALSQSAIVTSWADAKFGTVPNLVALGAAVYAFAAYGPFGLRAAYSDEATRALAASKPGAVLTDADLARLPAPVGRYLRLSGAVDRPRPGSVRARWKGRIRGFPADPWMEFTAEQVNTYGATMGRLFLMDATMKGLPVTVLHRFLGSDATFQARLLSLLTVAHGEGPVMRRSETVTLFNDICMLAPGRLADPAIRWEALDDHRARATFSRGSETISAELRFDDSGALVDFVSDDRARASSDGKSFSRLRWSTPFGKLRAQGSPRVPEHGEARWHETDGTDYAYIQMDLLDLVNDPTPG